MDKTRVHLLGVEKGNGTTLTRNHDSSKIETNPVSLDWERISYLLLNDSNFQPVKRLSVSFCSWCWNRIASLSSVSILRLRTGKEHLLQKWSLLLSTRWVSCLQPCFWFVRAWTVCFAFAPTRKSFLLYLQNLYIPITLRTAEGSLNALPEKLVFEQAYPGKVPSQEFKILSSFKTKMDVRDVTFQPNDTRFIYEAPRKKPVEILPNASVIIGKIYFDAKRECKDDCYLGLPTSIPGENKFFCFLEVVFQRWNDWSGFLLKSCLQRTNE